MRRKDKEVTDRSLVDSIIMNSKVCRLAMSENNNPYVVPLSFGYDGKSLYFHGAKEGKKISVLKNNSRVCFEFESECDVVKADKACKWSMEYKSVVGYGKASFVEGMDLKRKALDIIMKHYSDQSFEYSDAGVISVEVIKVDIESLSGKNSHLR